MSHKPFLLLLFFPDKQNKGSFGKRIIITMQISIFSISIFYQKLEFDTLIYDRCTGTITYIRYAKGSLLGILN